MAIAGTTQKIWSEKISGISPAITATTLVRGSRSCSSVNIPSLDRLRRTDRRRLKVRCAPALRRAQQEKRGRDKAMKVELSQFEIDLLDRALTAYEHEAPADAAMSTVIGMILAPSEHREEFKREGEKVREAGKLEG